jgi:transcription initiation factor TFIID subunit TAF12
MQKMRRGSAAGNYKAPEFFTAINSLATATCTRAMPLGLACCPSVARELGPAGVARVKQRLAALQHQQQQEQAQQQRQQPGQAGSTSNVDL